jgi:peroxiredoxin
MYNSFKRKKARTDLTTKLLQDMNTIEIGKPLPDHVFEDLDGKLIRLSEMIGKRKLIIFLSTDCGHCLELLNTVNRVVLEKEQDAQILFVSSDDRVDLQQAIIAYGIRSPILWDRDATYSSNLRITTSPFSVLVDSNLIVTWVNSGEIDAKEIEARCF